MERSDAVALLDELHRRQNVMYAGGDPAPVLEMLDADVAWHVPGTSPIAGVHRGHPGVLAYFELRRRLAGGTMRIVRRDVLVGETDAVAALSDGERTGADGTATWSTVGVYRLRERRVVECRLLPFSVPEFDRIWSEPAPG